MRQVLVLILLLCVLTTAWSVCICLPPEKAFAAGLSWTCPVCKQTFQFDPRDSAYRDSFAQRHLNAHGYQRPSAPPSYRAPKAPSGPTPEQLERQRQRELKKQRQIEQWQRQKQLQKQRQIRAKNEAYNKGNDYFGRGNWDKAISYYKEALKYDPNDQTIKRRIKQAQAHKVGDKGDKYYNKEDWGNAIKYYKAALRQDPNNATFRRNLQKAEAEAKKGQQKKLAEAKEKQQEKRLREQGTKETLAETSRRLDNLAAELRRPGSSDLWEGAARPGTTRAPATGQSLDFIDSSVVDLRDAKTLTVYPDVVKGTSTVAMELTAEGWRDTTTPSGSEAKPGATSAPATGQSLDFVDSSVVDLRDAKTLVVDPAKVKGDLRDAPADQPAGQGQGSTGQTAQPGTGPSVADELAAAIAHLPEKAQAGVMVGTALISQGKYEEAVKYFEDALEAAPNDEGVRRVLTRAYILRDKALGVPGSPKAEILLDALEVSGARNWDDIRFWQGQLAQEKDPAKVEAIRRNLNESVDRSWEHSIGYLQGQLAQEKDPAKQEVIGKALNEAFNARIQVGEERIRELTGLPFGYEAKGTPPSPKAQTLGESEAYHRDNIKFWQGQLAQEKDPAKVEAIRRNLDEDINRKFEHSIGYLQGQLAQEKDPVKQEEIRVALNETIDARIRVGEERIRELTGLPFGDEAKGAPGSPKAESGTPPTAQIGTGPSVVDELDAATAHLPEKAKAGVALGTLMISQGKYEEAVRYFEDAVKAAPDDQFLQRARDHAYSQRDIARGAPAEQPPEQPPGQGQGLPGGTTAQIGTGPSVVDELDAATAHLPERARAGVAVGTLMISQGKYEEAVKYFEDAVEVAPNDEGLQRVLDYAYTLRDKAQGAPGSPKVELGSMPAGTGPSVVDVVVAALPHMPEEAQAGVMVGFNAALLAQEHVSVADALKAVLPHMSEEAQAGVVVGFNAALLAQEEPDTGPDVVDKLNAALPHMSEEAQAGVMVGFNAALLAQEPVSVADVLKAVIPHMSEKAQAGAMIGYSAGWLTQDPGTGPSPKAEPIRSSEGAQEGLPTDLRDAPAEQPLGQGQGDSTPPAGGAPPTAQPDTFELERARTFEESYSQASPGADEPPSRKVEERPPYSQPPLKTPEEILEDLRNRGVGTEFRVFDPDFEGRIESIKGAAYRMIPEGRWVPVQEGTRALEKGETLWVPPGSSATISFSDGTKVDLKAETLMYIEEESGWEKFKGFFKKKPRGLTRGGGRRG